MNNEEPLRQQEKNLADQAELMTKGWEEHGLGEDAFRAFATLCAPVGKSWHETGQLSPIAFHAFAGAFGLQSVEVIVVREEGADMEVFLAPRRTDNYYEGGWHLIGSIAPHTWPARRKILWVLQREFDESVNESSFEIVAELGGLYTARFGDYPELDKTGLTCKRGANHGYPIVVRVPDIEPENPANPSDPSNEPRWFRFADGIPENILPEHRDDLEAAFDWWRSTL